MAARIDPQGMVDAFRRLNEHGDQVPRIARYLSTHPQIEDRVERLQRVADNFTGRTEELRFGDWNDIAFACKP